MKRLFLYLITFVCACSMVQAQSVGLVLSGGGAKGIAHIGVIQALEDNDIPIDYITGTSMGAIVGGLYAAGYSPAEMMQLLNSKDFVNWSTGVINQDLTYYFDKATRTPAFLNVNFAIKDSTAKASSIIPSSLVNPIPMNFGFMELFAPYSAQCGNDFDKLFVPFRCIASDVFNKREIVCSNGNLGDAIRASMSFPLVFKPIYNEDTPLFDGGIYNNFPVNVMQKDFAPEFILGIDVSTASSKINMNNLVDQVEAMVIQDHGATLPESSGIRMNLNLSKFQLLDFQKANEIYKVGYDQTIAIIDSIKARVQTRVSKESRAIARNSFKSKTPNIVFDKVEVTGTGNSMQNAYLEEMFTIRNQSTFDIEEAKISYYHAISSQKLNDLVPSATYNDSTHKFTLNLKASPKDNFHVGVGGFLTSSTNSMMYIDAGFRTLSFNSFDAGIKGWIGQSYYAGEVGAKISLRTHIPSHLSIYGVVSKQKFYENDMLFYADDLPTFITNHDNHARLTYAFALGRKAKMGVSVGYGMLRDYFYQSNNINYNTTQPDKATYRLGQARISIERNSLNHPMYPSNGSRLSALGFGVLGKYNFEPNANNENQIPDETNDIGWIQGELDLEHYFPIGKHFVIGAKLNGIASTKQLTGNYTANMIQAPAFAPTPSTTSYFNPAFRANSYIAGGIVPLVKLGDNLQFRTEFYAFAPFQKIIEDANMQAQYGRWFDSVSYLGEASIVYNLPFASFSIYGNYLSYPKKNWNFGISFGLLLTAPKFLR